MPKYYCDYCDIFLTHDSPSVRKSHNEGWKHKAAVRMYYAQFAEEHAQMMMNQKLREWETQQQQTGNTSQLGAPPPQFPFFPGMVPNSNPPPFNNPMGTQIPR